ncbi:SpoIIE family protein phosphatase [Streptomyces mirabilis]|uniref:SpoIIE family protein phosphatase n=1 Tax=Streptomyces mirabilis TaxID=68239 RepID=UPI00364CBDC9
MRVRPADKAVERPVKSAASAGQGWWDGVLPACWLLIEWPTDAEAPTDYWLSNLPADTPVADLARLAKVRWRIEHDYREHLALGQRRPRAAGCVRPRRGGLLLVPPGPPLSTGGSRYRSFTGSCAPGHPLLLYTDGLVERRHEDIDGSLCRLTRIRTAAAVTAPGDLLDLLLAEIVPDDPADDIALIAARPGRQWPT